ncbi:MAG: decarboxylase [Candidatus Nanoarchaeia archaeon]|jgi:ornithine decarboxylase
MKAKFILSKSVVLEKYNELKNMGLRVSFSYKTNPLVAEVLTITNAEFSVHSITHIKQIKDKSRVWFLPQGWAINEIKLLLDMGVNKFIVDNEHDLLLLDEIMRQSDKKISLLIRIKMKENTVYTGRYFVYGFRTARANELINEFSTKSYINDLGIHFHRKTENVGEWAFLDELKDSINCWDKIKIVNIGGGLPVKYANVKDFNIKIILNQVLELKSFLDSKNIQLMIEPGRYISAPAIKLVTEIINIADNNLFINCSVYNSFPDTLFYSLRLPVADETITGKQYLIKGNTACSLDIFRYKFFYQHEPKIGDQLVFLNAGAYNFYTDFMGLEPLETEIIE